nr:DUF1156 domain-containing protein [Candidatus Njordarchaeota archaeon]
MIPAECKRLIEVDLPIKLVSDSATHEKNIRQGHISSLHIWWARRPLAACRAVILGALLPDPVDPNCPEDFKKQAWKLLSPLLTQPDGDNLSLRKAILDFIADFSVWENSRNESMIGVAQGLVKAAFPDMESLVVDPFAGGGAIPLEVLRVGAHAFAVDYSPVAVLLLKTVLEYIPRHGLRLAQEVKRLGGLLKERARKELCQFYPQDKDGSVPLAYLWARTAKCEGPGCGAEIPLLKRLWIVNSARKKVAFKVSVDKAIKQVSLQIVDRPPNEEAMSGTVRRGAMTCPICDYTTPVERIRIQANVNGLKPRLVGVVTHHPRSGERKYRSPTDIDLSAVGAAEGEFKNIINKDVGSLSPVPDESLPPEGTLGPRVINYGMKTWGDLFTARQALAILTFSNIIREFDAEGEINKAAVTCAALALSNSIHYQCNLATYLSDGVVSVFIQGLGFPMRWDFAEANPLIEELVGGFDYSLNQVIKVIEANSDILSTEASVRHGSATSIRLPDASAVALITDPPYYDSVPYANASELFYVWLRRAIRHLHPDLFTESAVPREEEIIVNVVKGDPSASKDSRFYEGKMRQALLECRRILMPGCLGVIVFAHKSTLGWEALLKAIIDSGWQITASWPIETERAARMRAHQTASLASSVFLACRVRKNVSTVGDWRQVLSELGPRVHAWMERLVEGGIVGADAIFACIGPALEIFSRYATVETAAGKKIELKEYLEHVWAAVAKEALDMIFEGADPSGFEQDGRLTAMWLWTLRTRTNKIHEKDLAKAIEEEEKVVAGRTKGYSLEYDAARKIAQGIGAHLEELEHPGGILEIKGKVATLFFVDQRRQMLFGRLSPKSLGIPKGQTTLSGELASTVEAAAYALETGRTTLDRLHQAMLLFCDGRSEALKRFLVDDEVGKDERFWRLAQSLSALYPSDSDEKRWVDGVLGRKKTFGF